MAREEREKSQWRGIDEVRLCGGGAGRDVDDEGMTHWIVNEIARIFCWACSRVYCSFTTLLAGMQSRVCCSFAIRRAAMCPRLDFTLSSLVLRHTSRNK